MRRGSGRLKHIQVAMCSFTRYSDQSDSLLIFHALPCNFHTMIPAPTPAVFPVHEFIGAQQSILEPMLKRPNRAQTHTASTSQQERSSGSSARLVCQFESFSLEIRSMLAEVDSKPPEWSLFVHGLPCSARGLSNSDFLSCSGPTILWQPTCNHLFNIFEMVH